ncbi:MAG: sulfur relay protein TusB/DsrH [Halieaceae bacterium]
MHCLYVEPGTALAERLRSCLSPGEPVLLLGDAAVLALAEHPQLALWLASDAALHVLDVDLRALGSPSAHPAIRVIDYAGWVSLSVDQPNQQAWY